MRLCQWRAVNASMFSDGVPYSFVHVIVDGKLRPALRTVIGLQTVVSKLVFLNTMFVIEASGGGWARFDV